MGEERLERVTVSMSRSVYLKLKTISRALGVGVSTLCRMFVTEAAHAIMHGAFVIDEEEMRMIDEVLPEDKPRYNQDIYLDPGVYFFLKSVADIYDIPLPKLCYIAIKKRLYATIRHGFKIDMGLIERILKDFEPWKKAYQKAKEMGEA